MEAESLKLRSEKMYQAELFQGDSGPGSVRIEIKPVGNEGVGKLYLIKVLNFFFDSFGLLFWKMFFDNFMDIFGTIFWRHALNLDRSVGKLWALFKAVLTQPEN